MTAKASRYYRAIKSLIGVGAVLLVAVNCAASAAAAVQTLTYRYRTDNATNEFLFEVPAGVTELHILALGAGGGGADKLVASGSPIPGKGAEVTETIPVAPGDYFYAVPGGAGGDNPGGFDGGGRSGTSAGVMAGGFGINCPPCFGQFLLPAGNGGGASAVRTGNAVVGQPVVVAGGGGGGGANDQIPQIGCATTAGRGGAGASDGANGGGGMAQEVQVYNVNPGPSSPPGYRLVAGPSSGGGSGASQSAGGGAGTSSAANVGATPGILNTGGNGDAGEAGGGGGGGGYYGGGGGGSANLNVTDPAGDECASGGGGGGGSSYPASASIVPGRHAGDGVITFTYDGPRPVLDGVVLAGPRQQASTTFSSVLPGCERVMDAGSLLTFKVVTYCMAFAQCDQIGGAYGSTPKFVTWGSCLRRLKKASGMLAPLTYLDTQLTQGGFLVFPEKNYPGPHPPIDGVPAYGAAQFPALNAACSQAVAAGGAVTTAITNYCLAVGYCTYGFDHKLPSLKKCLEVIHHKSGGLKVPLYVLIENDPSLASDKAIVKDGSVSPSLHPTPSIAYVSLGQSVLLNEGTIADFLKFGGSNQTRVAVMGLLDPAADTSTAGTAPSTGTRYVGVPETLDQPPPDGASLSIPADTTILGTDGKSYSATDQALATCSSPANLNLQPASQYHVCVVFELPKGVGVARVLVTLSGNMINSAEWYGKS